MSRALADHEFSALPDQGCHHFGYDGPSSLASSVSSINFFYGLLKQYLVQKIRREPESAELGENLLQLLKLLVQCFLGFLGTGEHLRGDGVSRITG